MKILPRNKKRLEILKGIINKYQNSDSEVYLQQILERIDNLILVTIVKERKWRPYLKDVPYKDLYHYGIIGAITGIKSIPKQEEIRYIPARVVAYIKAQLRKSYKHHLREVTNLMDDDENNPIIPVRTAQDHQEQSIIEARDVKHTIDNLYRNGKVSDFDMWIINRRFYDGLKFREIAALLTIPLPTAWHKYSNTLTKIRGLFGELEE